MTLTFLGTGTSQGIPVIGCQCEVCQSPNSKDKRLRTSVHLQIGDQSWVIDSGPDFRQQMLQNTVQKLDALLFTHGHKDHTAGFDDIRGFNFVQQKAMEVYLDEYTEKTIRNDFHYVFAEKKYPGVPQANLHRIDNQPFEINGVRVLPIQVMHYKLPVFGFRIGDLAYITDANFIAPAEFEKIKGAKVLVINALRKSQHISHFTLEEAVRIIREIKPEKAFLIHMSHQMGLHDSVNAELPEGISLAYDGLKVEV